LSTIKQEILRIFASEVVVTNQTGFVNQPVQVSSIDKIFLLSKSEIKEKLQAILSLDATSFQSIEKQVAFNFIQFISELSFFVIALQELEVIIRSQSKGNNPHSIVDFWGEVLSLKILFADTCILLCSTSTKVSNRYFTQSCAAVFATCEIIFHKLPQFLKSFVSWADIAKLLEMLDLCLKNSQGDSLKKLQYSILQDPLSV
jgi:hypothetical protein